MRHSAWLFFLLLTISLSCRDNTLQPTQPTEYGGENDYIIYEKLLQSQFAEAGYFIILRDSTKGEALLDYSLIANIYKEIPALLEETVTDYLLKRDKKVKIKSIPNIKSIAFSSEIKVEPDHFVFVYFSNVGYNKSETQAIVTLGVSFGIDNSRGALFFLSKDENEWIIKNIYGLWIS
jgi:hypothetical protein